MATLDELFGDQPAAQQPASTPAATPVQDRYTSPPQGRGLKTLKIPFQTARPAAPAQPVPQADLAALLEAVEAEPPRPEEAPCAAVTAGSGSTGTPGNSVQPTPTTAPPADAGATSTSSTGDDGPTIDTILAKLHPVAYLAGAAGTGKTFLARQLVQTRQDTLLTATTGIAAVNLGDAATINSVLQYFDTQSLMESYASGYLATRFRQLRRSGIRIIVLDEVSMLDADQLSIFCNTLDDVNLKKSYDASLGDVSYETDDEAEMKLLLVGDFAQLPPVEADFAFQAVEWKRFADSTIRLDRIRRQGDQSFIQALQAVRRGNAQAAIPVLEPRMVPSLDFGFNGTTIVAKNDEVDRINGLRHAKLPGPEYEWKTQRSGEQQKDWLRLIPEVVTLKKGAMVMILANRPLPRLDEDDPISGYFYVNGDLATVVGKENSGIRVMLHRTFEEVTVIPAIREWKVATGKRKPRWDIKGTCTYMPLRLAYATTVHKSQGLSLDEVQISMASWMFSKPGMMYVALSRCRSLEGLRIVGNAKMFAGKCAVDPRIKEFL